MRSRNFPIEITESQKWNSLYKFYKEKRSVVGKITKYNGYFGFTVNIDGINADMAFKELSYGYIEEPEKFIGIDFLFVITRINVTKRELTVSRKRLVENAKAGDILNGLIIDIEENYLTVDVGFACRVLKKDLLDRFVNSIYDYFMFYTTIEVVLQNDFKRLKFTFASTKKLQFGIP